MASPAAGSEYRIALPYDPSLLPQGFTEDDIRTYVYDRQYHRWVAIQRDSLDTDALLVCSRFRPWEKGLPHTQNDLADPQDALAQVRDMMSIAPHGDGGDSPLDFINAVLKTPEMPETSAYTPTSIKELKAADPLEGLTLMQPPTANNSGTANLSYPIDIPAGRQGMQPSLALTYSSGGGNGWLGVGWDISIPSITVETRWGVPRYDQSKESETYLFSGEQLATKDSAGNYEDLSHRAVWKNRDASITEKQFYPRVEGAFQRIIRHGTTPKNYWWEVRDKQGVTYYYGRRTGQDSPDQEAVLTDNSGNIAQWMLTEVRDLNGNYVRYEYQTVRQGYGNSAPKNIYPKEISYTLHDSLDAASAHYALSFVLKHNDDCPTTSGRFGFLQTFDQLLEAIVVKLQLDELSYQRIKAYTFCYGTGMYGKTLLKDIGQIAYNSDSLEGQTDNSFCGSPANLVTHTFKYYDETDISDVFGESVTMTTGNDRDAAKRIIPMKIAASSLGGVYSDGWNVGGALTVGFGFNSVIKSLTAGGDYMHSRSESEGILALIDIDGDGLPDKVFRSGDNDRLYYRSQYVGQDGDPHFSGIRTPIAGIDSFMNERSRTNDWGLEAHLSFYGAGLSAAYNHSTSKSSGTVYFSDVDGDGLPDIVKGGQVYFNRYVPGNDSLRFTRITSETVMVGGSCDSSFIFQDEPVNESMFLPGDTVITIWYERVVLKDSHGKDSVCYVEHFDTTITQAIVEYAPDFDAVKLWEAPYNGVVRLESKARLTQDLQFARYASRVMDGVRVSIQKNDGADLFIRESLSPDTMAQDGHICMDTTIVGIPVEKGDRFYFRVESLDKRLYDKVFWDPKFVYTEIDGVTPEDPELVDADGRYIYKFSSVGDFLINPDRKYHIAMDSVSTITVESDFSILEGLSDSVTLHFYHNGNNVITPAGYGKLHPVTHHTDSFSITVNEGDSIWFELECGTNVNWKAIDWRARYYYTQVSDTSVEVWDSYTDTAKMLPAIVYDNMVPHLTSYPRPVLPTVRIKTDRLMDLSYAEINLEGSNGVSNATLSLKEETNGAVLAYPLSFDIDGIASLDTIFIMTADNVYYLDLYSNDYYELADVHNAYISLQDGSRLDLGLHISQPDSLLVFGDMYQNWGQFSYRKGTSDERELDESRLVVSQKAQTPPDTASTTLDTTDASAFHSGLSNAVFDPVEESFLMCEPDRSANRWLGYGNIVYFSPDTISNTYSSDPTGVDETEFPVPVTVDGSPAFAVSRNSITKTHTINVGISMGIPINGGNVSPSGGKSWHWGNTRTLSDFYDMNGDRYPDVISGEQVQYTKPQGGLSSLKLGHNILGSPLDTTTFNGESSSFGASFTLAKKVPSSKPSSKQQHEIGGSAGLNGCSGVNRDEDEHVWTDLNGDGLPDRVSKNGKVFYNLGYSFVEGGLSDSCGRAGSSINIGGSAGGGFNYGLLDSLVVQGLKKDDNSEAKPTEVNLFETSISAGYGFTRNINNTDKMMVDVNGDGLPECVQRSNGVLKVRYNKGNGFVPEDTLLSGEGNLYTTLSTCSNINGAVSVGFSLGCFPIKFVVNPKGGYTRSMGKTEVQLTDINGDGLPDYVTSGDIGHMQVRFNQSGKANLLKTVTNLAGGGMTMDYKLSDYMGYDCPNRIQVLDSLFVYDGLEDDWNDTMRYSFEYDSAYYDRFERTTYGFGVVKTHSLNSNRTVYRTVTERYSNRYYKFRNLKTYELLTDGNGRKYVEKFFTYVPKEIATGTVVNEETDFCFGESYPALNKEEVLYYDDNENVRVVTRKHYEHGQFGNLIKYTDAGQAGVAEDSIIVTMTYHPDSAGKNLTGMVKSMEAKDYRDSLLRKKDCDVNYGTGQIRQLRMYNDLDTAVTDFAYDSFGNLVQVTGPANNQNQRVIYRYSYDSDIHTCPERVKNVPFGYVSTTTYDLRIGKPLSTTDINGNVMTYEYDRSGRLTSILAPADTGYTLRFEYWITYDGDTVHQGDNPWARTSHFDIQHPDNPLNTTVIADGFGRIVQTRKDAEVGGCETSLVSGVVIYDCFGRAVRQFYPFTDEILTETYFQSDTSNGLASTTTYDILDRQILVTQPHGVRTAMNYGFGQKGEKWYFLSSATDAKQNMLTTLTDSRGLKVQQTAPGNTVTKFSYDPLGQLTSSTDPMNLITTYAYDMFGQLRERVHPDAGTDTYEYDAAGNMVSHTNGNNKTIQYRYDHNRLTDVEYPDHPANNVHYTYGDSTTGDNCRGRVVLLEDGSGFQTFKYGRLGEITENSRTLTPPFEQQAYTFKTKFSYDSWNRIDSMIYPDGEVVHYKYDRGGMLNKVYGSVTRNIWEMVEPVQIQGGHTAPEGILGGGGVAPGDPPGPVEPETVTFRYPYIDSVIYNIFELKDSVVYGNGTRVRYEYDSLQRLTRLRSYAASGAKMQDISYTYDGVGNIMHISNTADGVNGLGGRYEASYTYDNLYRLTTANGFWNNGQDSLPFSETMGYEANGRILKKTENASVFIDNVLSTKRHDCRYSYADGNQLSSIADRSQPNSPHSFQWDLCGNLVRWVMPSATGKPITRVHTWTEDNRLRTVADRDHFSYYQYDASGERTYKLTWSGSWSNINGVGAVYYLPEGGTLYASPYLVITQQGYTKHYYAEAERITSQLGKGQFADVGTPVVSDSLVHVKLQAVTCDVDYPSTLTEPDSGAFAYLDTLTNQQDAVSTLYFYHPDHLGSSSWITNANGAAVQHLHYLPWGEDFVDQRLTGWAAPYTFSAKEKDAETGLSYFGARYYSSDLSIWLSVDPMSDKYPSLSPYAYCANNPIKLVDPNGEKIWIHDEEGGSAANAFYQELVKWASSENINLSLGTDGYLNASFNGEYTDLSDDAQNFLHAVYNQNITVDIMATSNDYGDNGYAFFCGTYKGVVYGYSNGEEVAHSYQVVNPIDLRQFDEYHQQPGQTSLHELMESYNAALMSISNCSSDNDSKRRYYQSSHQNAPPQSGTFKKYYAKNGHILREKLPSYKINTSKWFIYYSSESGDEIFKKIPITNR